MELNALSKNVNLKDHNNYLTQQQKFSGYYDDNGHINRDYSPAKQAGAEATDSSHALSAVTLIGFLYFLNLMQNVVNNTNGRRRRREIKSEDELLVVDPDKNPAEELEARSREPKLMEYLEDFFIQLPYSLGLRRQAEVIERGGREEDKESTKEESPGFVGMLSSRLGMISSIMSFLKDPGPTRIKRDSVNTATNETEVGFWYSLIETTSEIAGSVSKRIKQVVRNIDSDMVMDFVRRVLDATAESEASETGAASRRVRRFTDEMNSWYSTLRGHNAQSADSVDHHSSAGREGISPLFYLGKILKNMNQQNNKV